MKRNFMWLLILLALATVSLWAAGDDGRPQVKTEVIYPCTVTLSPPFRDLPVQTDKVQVGKEREIPNQVLPRAEVVGAPEGSSSGDGALQTHPGLLAMPGTVAEFAGISNLAGVAPPDTEGDIGPDHYVQWVNLHLAAWQIDRSSTPYGATLVLGPITGTTIWSSLGGPCAANNDGDPIVLWDRFRNRWVISQFNLPDPYYQAIAVSQTADPTGSWYLYCFQYDATNMNDYPKFGVWPDGYYMTVNQFANMSSWAGAGLCVFEADKMINGDPTARMLKVDLGAINSNYGSILPAHFEGMTNPPAGSPCYFVEMDDGAWIPGYPNDALRLWEGHVDWTAGTFAVGVAGEPNLILDTAAFDPLCIGNRNCIPQPGTTQRLDSLGDRLMYRLQYRNYGSYESMVVNQSVDVGSGRSGVRWYELRKSGTGTWSIFQQGTYAPADGLSRWMGSAAQDHMGNLAVGYSVSDATSMYPSIYYAGRLASDPAGDLTQGEALMYLGAASQTGVNRWGDYSTMSIDPEDDCTFWYTTEYSTGGWNWATRIGAFKYGTCSVGPTGTLAGTVTDSATTLPLSGVTVTATNGTITVNTTTAADGTYSMTLPVSPPTYDVSAARYGYVPAAATGLSILSGMTTTQDFALAPAPSHVVSGTVTDATTGWPLYASLAVAAPGYPGATIWNDPVTGFYSIALADGIPYTFTVTSFISGYEPGTATVTPLGADMTQDFALSVNAATCVAPGYVLGGGVFESFDTTAPPAGWTVTNNGGACTWVFNNPGGRSNLTGGSGNFAVADSDECGSGTTMNTELRTPVMDFTGVATVPMTFRSDYNNLSSSESADVDVSVNGAAGPWTNVWHRNVDARGPMQVTLDLSAIAGNQSNVMVRFHYVAPGWDWWWEVDDVAIGAPVCTAPAGGGLIVGNVYDGNTNLPLNGATVTNSTTGGAATTVPTPDPAVDEGFYFLYGAEPTSDLAATMTGYGPDWAGVSVPHFGAIRQDFHLPTGRLEATPSPIEVTVSPAAPTTSATLTLSETGGTDVTFDIRERDGHIVAPEGRMARLTRPYMMITRKFEGKGDLIRQTSASGPDARTSQSLQGSAPEPPAHPTRLAAGDVLASWAGPADAWGVTYDGINRTVWVGDGWGTARAMNEYQENGTATGRSWPYAWIGTTNGPGDYCFDWTNGTIWVMNIHTGTANCIFEVDPATGYTGNSICPGGGTGFSTSQRGVAFNPTDDTFFAGGWNDYTVYEFDRSGTILRQVNVGLEISGLAYNPDTQHLFVMTNSSPNLVHVLDAANNFASLGQFSIAGFGDYSGAGLEIDCDGHLWAVDQVNSLVVQVDSGETASLCASDVPWLAENPVTGTVTGNTSEAITVDFDATGLAPGDYLATLLVNNDTLYGRINVPVTMHVAYDTLVATAGSDVSFGEAPLTVNFTGAATGGDGVYTWAWDFGDGGTSTDQNPTHVYTTAGFFMAVLTVTDGQGTTATDTVLIQVTIPFDMNFYDYTNRAQLCVWKQTGAYRWIVLSGPYAGMTFEGTGVIANGGTAFWTNPADPTYIYATYDSRRHRARAYLTNTTMGVYSAIVDTNTLDNPPCGGGEPAGPSHN